MKLEVINCPSCGAALNELPYAGHVQCEFCGAKIANNEPTVYRDSNLIQLFTSGCFDECQALAAERLRLNPKDEEALFYRALSLLFSKNNDYVLFDNLLLSYLEKSATPVGIDKKIFGDLDRAFSINKNLWLEFYKVIKTHYQQRKYYQFYPRETEKRILSTLAESVKDFS